MTLATLAMSVTVVGQSSRSNDKNHIFIWLLPCFRVNVKGLGQRQRSGSRVKGQGHQSRSKVNIRGSALISAAKSAKSNKSHYQSNVFVCVSLISGRMKIIARMRSISF